MCQVTSVSPRHEGLPVLNQDIFASQRVTEKELVMTGKEFGAATVQETKTEE